MEHIESHSEAEIVNGCIALMQELTGRFEEYLDYMDIAPGEGEDRFLAGFSYFEIVQRLMLWKTYHSGGDSTRQKCAELGFDFSGLVVFRDERDKEGENG